jgi:K+-transporting ATPase A subunit
MKNWVTNYVVWLGIAIIAAALISAWGLYQAGKRSESVAVVAWVTICFLLIRRATRKQRRGVDAPQDETQDVQPQ